VSYLFRSNNNFSVCFSLRIFSNCFSVALNIFFRDLNSIRRFCAVVGPISGKPSRMNCFCSSGVCFDFVWRSENSCCGLSWRFAIWIRNFTVSSSFSV